MQLSPQGEAEGLLVLSSSTVDVAVGAQVVQVCTQVGHEVQAWVEAFSEGVLAQAQNPLMRTTLTCQVQNLQPS